MEDSELSTASLAQAAAHFIYPVRVRFQDVDAAGIVFFARFFDYLHDAYVACLDAGGVHLADVLGARTWAAPLTHAEADFLKPVRFGDELAVGLAVARWQRSRLMLGYRITRSGDSATVAVGRTVHAVVDAASFGRIEVPEALRRCFARFGEPYDLTTNK